MTDLLLLDDLGHVGLLGRVESMGKAEIEVSTLLW